MSPSDSFRDDGDHHSHQSPPAPSFDDGNNNFSENPHIPNHGIVASERRSQNGCHLDEEEKREEMRNQNTNEGEEYNKHSCNEPNKGNHWRETDMLELGKEEKSQKEADKNYWRAIVDLIPPQDNPSSVVISEGPESAKTIDPARLRQISLRLRQSLLSHIMPSPPTDPKYDAADSY